MADKTSRIRRSDLTNDERIAIAESLQLRVLEQIGRLQGEAPGLVFHGGTAISLLHGSPRWSEDLDFMATPEAVSRLFGRAREIGAALQMQSSLTTPGATVGLSVKGSGDPDRTGTVERLNVRWEHPEKLGAIRIKVEFYTCPEERLAAYLAAPRVPAVRGFTSRSPIAGAAPVSIWADKIVALAQRPVLKQRDIHDLGFIAPMVPADADRAAALAASMGIYGRRPDEIRDGLERDFVHDAGTDRAAFDADMARWFSTEDHARMRADGHLDALFGAFRPAFELGRDLVSDMSRDAECGL
ncbi:nucleotidyl transferase AbiEii/AbiGii toxin family protein [Defluviimonas salinarum]|uniref:nucleotidyl transferase AbiEii/AbiGii toxin family protein n=1 Tax=Defluviimonas salinarum TaxID=2992147 RepID=UPI0022325254